MPVLGYVTDRSTQYFRLFAASALINVSKNLNYEEDKAKKRIFNIVKKFDTTSLLYKNLEDLLEYEKVIISFMALCQTTESQML